MFLISSILTLIVVTYIVASIKNAFYIRRWIKEQKKAYINRGSFREKQNITYFLLVPALREQAVINRTLTRLCKLLYDPTLVTIVVALDTKEKIDNYGCNTYTVVKRFVNERASDLPIIHIVAYSSPHQGRAYQLNSALDFVRAEVERRGVNSTKVFVGVYDADSFPDLEVLGYVAWKVALGHSLVAFQQCLDYRLNIDRIKSLRYPWLLEANTKYQTSWNYIFEVPRFLMTNSEIQNGKSVSFPPYCMGHGEFVRLDVLEQLGGFSIEGVADGIQLGFALSMNNFKIEPVPYVDVCESPISHIALIHQHSLWFAGNLSVLRYAISSGAHPTIQLRWIGNHILLILKWLFRPLIVSGLVIFFGCKSFQNGFYIPLILLMILFCTIFLYGFMVLYITADNEVTTKIKHLKILNYLWKLIWVLTSVAYKSIGAWLGLFKIFWGCVYGQHAKFRKIERV